MIVVLHEPGQVGVAVDALVGLGQPLPDLLHVLLELPGLGYAVGSSNVRLKLVHYAEHVAQ